MEWETKAARRDYEDAQLQNLNERQECQQWKQRFCLEQTEHGKLQERQLNTESELTGFKKVQGEAEFQFKEFEQTKTM